MSLVLFHGGFRICLGSLSKAAEIARLRALSGIALRVAVGT